MRSAEGATATNSSPWAHALPTKRSPSAAGGGGAVPSALRVGWGLAAAGRARPRGWHRGGVPEGSGRAGEPGAGLERVAAGSVRGPVPAVSLKAGAGRGRAGLGAAAAACAGLGLLRHRGALSPAQLRPRLARLGSARHGQPSLPGTPRASLAGATLEPPAPQRRRAASWLRR